MVDSIYNVHSMCRPIMSLSEPRLGLSAQEDMYSYVSVAEDQSFKDKGTVIVDDA